MGGNTKNKPTQGSRGEKSGEKRLYSEQPASTACGFVLIEERCFQQATQKIWCGDAFSTFTYGFNVYVYG
jgi:hypothetical protein